MLNKMKKTRAGFTLVELIVVIAILAVLAGVAIPVYSGYIQKANEAADLILLDATNSAFAAACMENGFSTQNVTSATLIISDNKIVGVSNVEVPDSAIFAAAHSFGGFAALSSKPTELGFDADKLNKCFLKYFGDNKNTELKALNKAGDIIFLDGVFQRSTADSTARLVARIREQYPTVVAGLTDEQVLTVVNTKNQVLDTIKGSSYEGNGEELLNDVQALTNAVLSVPETYYGALLGGAFGDYLEEVGATTSQEIANYAILFISDQVSGLSDAQKAKISEIWTNNNFYYGTNPSDVLNGVKSYANSETGLSTMGAMALFYANCEAAVQNMDSNYNPTDETALAQKQGVIDAFQNVAKSMENAKTTDDIWNALYSGYGGIMNACKNNQDLRAALMNYGSSNGATDAQAFIDAMGAINDNAEGLSTMTDMEGLYAQMAGLFN